jgi:oxygen-independent coproporphyrinogen-3 oxidase
LARVAAQGNGFDPFVPVAPEDAAREHLLMNLRLRDGIDRLDYRARWGRDLDDDRVRSLTNADFIEDDGRHLRATAKGRLVLNTIIAILADAI